MPAYLNVKSREAHSIWRLQVLNEQEHAHTLAHLISKRAYKLTLSLAREREMVEEVQTAQKEFFAEI